MVTPTYYYLIDSKRTKKNDLALFGKILFRVILNTTFKVL